MQKTNKLKKIDASIATLLIIGILVLLNFFSYQIFHRFDLTQNKDYSISQVSKEMLSHLDDVVNIKAYFSKELPPQFASLPQDVKDVLDEYVNYSGGKIKVEFIDPGDDEELKRKLYFMGIPELQFNVYEKDKAQMVRGYLGIAVQYGDKTEALPVVKSTNNLEYDLTVAIKKVTSDSNVNIGVLSGKKSLNLSDVAKNTYDNLTKIYSVSTIDLENTEEIPDTINTFIIPGPKEEFSEDDLKKIDSFFMKGKSLLVLLDGVTIGEGLQANTNKTKLEGLLEKYGVKVKNNLVLDVLNSQAPFSQGFITFMVNYPFWPKAMGDNLDRNNPVTAQLESLVFPWVSSIEIISGNMGENNQVSYLVKTTEKAWEENNNFNLNPQQKFLSGDRGKKTLAVLASGQFKSPYTDQSTDSARLAVVGDSDFVKEGIITEPVDNANFFQNLVDSLSMDASLINIRSKGVTSRPIKELTDTQKMLIRYLNVFGITVLVIIFGLLRYFMRRKSRFVDEL